MKTETRRPGAPRWNVETFETVDSSTGEIYYTFTPVLTSCLCAPIRFAIWQALASDPEKCREAERKALASAKEALALIAREAAEEPDPPPVTDSRYTVTLTYCGYETPRWVARFCGEWLSAFVHEKDAWDACREHAAAREKELTGA